MKKINKIKELEKVGTELWSLEVKIMMQRIKEELEEFEIKILETEIQNMTEALKQKEKLEGTEKWKKELEEMELKEIVEIMVKNVWFSYLSIETK